MMAVDTIVTRTRSLLIASLSTTLSRSTAHSRIKSQNRSFWRLSTLQWASRAQFVSVKSEARLMNSWKSSSRCSGLARSVGRSIDNTNSITMDSWTMESITRLWQTILLSSRISLRRLRGLKLSRALRVLETSNGRVNQQVTPATISRLVLVSKARSSQWLRTTTFRTINLGHLIRQRFRNWSRLGTQSLTL